jgi:hypothetical protein
VVEFRISYSRIMFFKVAVVQDQEALAVIRRRALQGSEVVS